MKSIVLLFVFIVLTLLSPTGFPGSTPPPNIPEPTPIPTPTRPVLENACSQPDSVNCSQTFFAAFPNVAAPFIDLIVDGVTDGTNSSKHFITNDTRTKKAAGDILETEKLGYFLSGITTNRDRLMTRKELGYDAEMAGLVTGLDYRFTDNLTAGLSLGYSDTDTIMHLDFGKLNLEAVTVLVHGIYTPANNFSFNSYLGWANLDFEGNRRIAGSSFARSQTDGDQFLAGLSAAYAYSHSGFTFSPQLSLDYLSTWIDGFTETGPASGSLQVDDQRVNSLLSRTGLNATYAWSQEWGVVLPQIRLFYIHEFLNSSRTILTSPVASPGLGGGFVTDSPDRNYYSVAAGVSTVLPYGIQLFVDYERLLGHRYFDDYTISGGLRLGF